MCSRHHRYICITISSFFFYKCFYSTFIVQDVSGRVLDEFRKRPRMSLPDVEYLKEHIDKELPEEIKIPLTQREFNMLISNDISDFCSPNDLGILFRVS